ncbi:MAG: right-handed parallel beta-helix repeat-containing protein [Desulfamplus sp.]|nr:right-handed parallel beta-helix repeat-containing protein [Desulfamplus sp.]
MVFYKKVCRRIFSQDAPEMAPAESLPPPKIMESRADLWHGTIRPSLWHPDDESWHLFRRIENNSLEAPSPKGDRLRPRNILPLYDLDRYRCHIPAHDFTGERLYHEAASLPGEGGDIHLPPGRVELHRMLKLPSNSRLIGSGRGSTLLVFQDVDHGICLRGSSGNPLFDISIHDITLSHKGVHKFCAAVFISNCRNLGFYDVEIIQPVGVGFLLADNVSGTLLSSCSVAGAGLGGYMLVRDVHGTVFDSCRAYGCGQSGVFLTDLKLPRDCDPLDFDHQIHHTTSVIGNFGPFDPWDPSPCRTTMNNCIFSGNRKMGVTTDGTGLLKIDGCTISHNDCEGITIDNGSWACIVQNSTITGNGWRGRQHSEELTVDFVNQMGLMPDKSSMAKLPGISFDNAANCRVENCLIEGNWGDGVKFVRAVYGCTVSSNLIIDNNLGRNSRFHFFGVLIAVAPRQHKDQADFPSCYNNIMKNDILGSHFAGIHLLPGTVGNVIEGNTISGHQHMAIENHTLEDDNLLIHNHTG